MALAVFSCAWITLLELDLTYDSVVLYFIFFASITGYNFVKFFSVAKFYHRRLANWLKSIQVLSFFSFLLMCFYAVQLQIKTIFIVGGFAVLTFLYATPFLQKKTQSLRSVEGLKVYIIALVWTGVTVFLPVIDEGFKINNDVILIAIQRFAYVLVLMLPFEIRDLKYDTLNLETIPQKIGVKKTKNLGVLLLVFILVLELFKHEVDYSRMLILSFMTVLTGMFVLKAKTEQGKYYCSFWVEGLPVLWLILMLIFV